MDYVVIAMDWRNDPNSVFEILVKGDENSMSEFLLLCNFFVGLIILIIELAIISDLQTLRADLYYYSEQNANGEKDELFEPF